jgi:hypothetical protein
LSMLTTPSPRSRNILPCFWNRVKLTQSRPRSPYILPYLRNIGHVDHTFT